MPQQDADASELDEAEEVDGVPLAAIGEPPVPGGDRKTNRSGRSAHCVPVRRIHGTPSAVLAPPRPRNQRSYALPLGIREIQSDIPTGGWLRRREVARTGAISVTSGRNVRSDF